MVQDRDIVAVEA